MRLQDLRLGVKQSIGFGCIICIMAAVNVALLRQVAMLRAEIVELNTFRLPCVITTFDLSVNLANLRTGQLQQAILTDPEQRLHQAPEMVELLDRIATNLAYYDSVRQASHVGGLAGSAREEALYRVFDEDWERYQDLFFEIMAHSEAGEDAQALAVLEGSARQVYDRINTALNGLVSLHQEEFHHAAQQAQSAYASTRHIILISLAVSLVVSVLAALALVTMVARPVGALASAVHRVADGDLDVHLERTSKDEIGRLSASFNQMTQALRTAQDQNERHTSAMSQANEELENRLQQIQELSRKNLEQERALRREMEKELETAHRMQMALMPERNPEIPGLEIAGRCLPATHVGGDFFQYFVHPDGQVSICLSDVAGHAMEAAIPMVMFSGILETEIGRSAGLESLYRQLNVTLHRILDARVFVCVLMGRIDVDRRVLRLANSGCPYPFLYSQRDGSIREIELDAYPLGVSPRATFPTTEVELASGDRIVFCSDGIIEAQDSDEEMFGFDQVAVTIRDACQRNCAAEEIIDRMMDAVLAHSGSVPQDDDQTMVVLSVI